MRQTATNSYEAPRATGIQPLQPRFESSRLPGESAAIWTLWLTYGAFYFCRTNISAAVPGLKASIGDGGLGLSGAEVGWILASLKIAYGVGQFFNGQMAERLSPRWMLALGMFGSAALNVVFGLGTGFYFLLFVWATNGFLQSLGWTPCVRVAANWVPVLRRGHAIGIIGTGYQITLGLTYLISGQAARWLGWQGALYVPAVLLAATGVFMLVFLRERPGEIAAAGRPAVGEGGVVGRPRHNGEVGEGGVVGRPRHNGETQNAEFRMQNAERFAGVVPRLSSADVLYWTLTNPALWLLGVSLGLLNACRYGFLDWGVTHLMETKKLHVDKATLQFFVIAIGAAAGSYLAGWATDRFFGGRRAPVVCVLMAALAGLAFVYDRVAQQGMGPTMLLLVVIGFCIYGPQVLLVGTAPADMARRGTSAAAAGFVNFLGYMGAASGDVVTGYFSSPVRGGWQVVIYIWAGWALLGAVIMAMLWSKKGETCESS